MTQYQFPIFCCFVFQKSCTGNILEIGRNKSQGSYFYPNKDEVQRRDEEALQGRHTSPWRGPAPGRAMGWCGRPVAPLRPFSGLCLRYGKILNLVFVSSNSENISCTTFLKYKTAENMELALWHLVNRLVPENI